VHQALLGGPPGAAGGLLQDRAIGLRQLGDHRDDVTGEEAAVILEPVARRGCTDPAGELHLAEGPRRW
jgi:hypothetical protein